MTRLFGKVSMAALALAIVAVAAGVSAAQDEPGRGGRGGGFGQGGGGGRGGRGGRGGQVSTVVIAANEKVQGLISATADQKTKITTISTELGTKQGELATASEGDFQAIAEGTRKLTSEAEDKVAAALDATQNTKVLSILANLQGAQSLTNAQIAKHLKLTEEQKTKLAAIAPPGRGAGGGGGGARGGMTPEEQAARDKQYTDVLTTEQAAEFAKLKAVQAVDEELATELRPRGRGGRGGRGGAGGPGGGGFGGGAGGPGGGGGFGGRGQQ
jgi:hypothetical protein